ncbi:hypothetical protein ACWDRR_12295 [Kitasatospora sp. NPDC003701]
MTDSATPHDSAATSADAPPAPAAPPAATFAPPAEPPAAEPAEAAVGAPGADPWAVPGAGTVPLLPPPSPEELAARRTRRRNAALRWGAAALVCALAGTGAAVAVTTPERTDIPGLATRSDGRYTFPALVLPPLPSGKAAPRENKSRHAADLRYLLLPAPKEAGGSLAPVVFPTPTAPPTGSPTASPSASPSASGSPSAGPGASPSGSTGPSAGATGAGAPTAEWAACDALAAEQKEPGAVRSLLLRNVCRAATVREWTASDGTRTQIRLLRFGSSVEAWDVFAELRANGEPKDLPGLRPTTPEGWDSVYGVDLATRESPASGADGRSTGRLAYLGAGDVIGVVTMTNPRGVPAAAFRQVVTLQSDLLA